MTNKTTKSIRIYWNNPVNELSSGVSFYVAIAERMMNTSSVSNGKLIPGNTTSSEITNLESYTEYSIYVIFVDSKGSPFKSAVLATKTDEGSKLVVFLWVITRYRVQFVVNKTEKNFQRQQNCTSPKKRVTESQDRRYL